MILFEGSDGLLCGYYKNELICSVPLTKHKNIDYYKKISNSVMIDALRGNHSICSQILLWKDAMEKMIIYKKNYLPRCSDRELNKYCLTGLLCLIKFTVIDEDGDSEGLLICEKYRR
tara:strand:- start:32 stop:382 length:351 start_codon:yes stop_codon:yes gene_type:complete